MTTTFEHLSTLLAEHYQLQPERLTPDATLASLGLDSLGTAEVLWHVEGLFNIELRPDPAGLATLGDLALCVDQQVAAQRRSKRGGQRPQANVALPLCLTPGGGNVEDISWGALPLPDRPAALFDSAQTQRWNAASVGANANPDKR